MRLVDFFSNVFILNIEIYLFCCVLIFFCMYFLYREYVNTLADPFFFRLFMASFAYVIPVFLYLTGNILLREILYFLISESFFWLGFMLIARKREDFSDIEIRNEVYISKMLFYFAVTIFFVSNILTYAIQGIPLFLQNRNDIYKDSDGLGLLAHLSGFASTFILIYSFSKYFLERKYLYKYFIFFVALNSILLGGKSGIMSVVYAYFFYSFFLCGKRPSLKKKYLILLFLFPLLILMLSSGGGGLLQSLLDLGIRFVANGDIYWSAYPNNVIDEIEISNPIVHFLIGFLGPLRIVSYEHAGTTEPIGLLIKWQVYPDLMKLGITTAPNSPASIVGWVYFKWWGVLFSFLLGLFVAYIMFRIRKYFPKSVLGIIFYSSLYTMATVFLTDPGLGVRYLFDCFLNFGLYLFFVFVVNSFRISYVK